MLQAKTRRKAPPSRAKAEKDLVTRLADVGEEALHRLTELPGGKRAATAFNELRARVDELGKKVRGFDELEARIAKLEKQVAELKPKRRTSRSRSTAKRPSS